MLHEDKIINPLMNDKKVKDYLKKIKVAHHEFQTKSYPRTNNDRRQEQRLNIERRKENGKIKKLAEILSICDMYDALASKRCYKKPLNKEEIEERIRKQFTGQKKYIKQILNVPKDLSRC